MATIVYYLLDLFAGVLALPVAVFCLEVVVGVLRAAPLPVYSRHHARARIAVVVPARNEGATISTTLEDITFQLRPGDRLVVVADNCTDDTAAVARLSGAEVLERNDKKLIGKGYALDCGIRHLDSDPPDVVVMIDADCRLAGDTIGQLASACSLEGRPAQALYLMKAPNNSQIKYQVAEFAWRVKNWLRPMGLAALRLPCHLMGSGMAFPWDVIHRAHLANDCLVEDIQLGLDLTLRGHPPVFCPSARVMSQFASSVSASRTQRERWELGQIIMILSRVPQLLCRAVAYRDWNLMALALDLAVPPLSLLAILMIGAFAVSSLFALLGISSLALPLSATILLAFLLANFLAWLKCGRDVVPIGATLSIVPYIFGKLGFYRLVLFRKPNARWINTERAALANCKLANMSVEKSEHKLGPGSDCWSVGPSWQALRVMPTASMVPHFGPAEHIVLDDFGKQGRGRERETTLGSVGDDPLTGQFYNPVRVAFSPSEQYRTEAEKAREAAKRAVSTKYRAFWLALAANWDKRAKAASAPKSAKNRALVK